MFRVILSQDLSLVDNSEIWSLTELANGTNKKAPTLVETLVHRVGLITNQIYTAFKKLYDLKPVLKDINIPINKTIILNN